MSLKVGLELIKHKMTKWQEFQPAGPAYENTLYRHFTTQAQSKWMVITDQNIWVTDYL